MWMVPPQTMCRAHLLGEHRELHALVGTIRRGTSLDGYVRNNLIETRSISVRHRALVTEMLRRGYRHHSPLFYVDTVDAGTVDRLAAQLELHRRCAKCASLAACWTLTGSGVACWI